MVFVPTVGLTWFSQETVELEDLTEREGLYYKKFTDAPFSGKVEDYEKRVGKWTFYYRGRYNAGDLRAKGNYKNGKKNGVWFYYHEFGYKTAEGKYVNGLREGFWRECCIKEGFYKNNKKDGEWKEYWVNNSFDEKIGAHIYSFDKKGPLFWIGNYSNDMRQGYFQYYSEDGRVWNVGSGTFKDDEQICIGSKKECTGKN